MRAGSCRGRRHGRRAGSQRAADRRVARGGEHRRGPRRHRAVAAHEPQDHDQRAADQHCAPGGSAGPAGEPAGRGGRGLMHMLGDLTGRTLLLFPESVGRRVCDMLLRRPVGTTAVFDALEQSCLKEAGNILAGAYLNALSDFMGMLLLPSVPSLVVDLSAAVLTTTYLNFGHERDFVFCVETEFTIDSGEGLRGDFLLLPDLASLKAIFDAIRLT